MIRHGKQIIQNYKQKLIKDTNRYRKINVDIFLKKLLDELQMVIWGKNDLLPFSPNHDQF